MSQYEKARARLMSRLKDFTWKELQVIMAHFGFVEKKGSGSKRKFVHHLIAERLNLHEPHARGILKNYAVRNIIDYLKRHNYL